MGQNLTGQLISATYEDLVQISGSRLTDGTGSNINNLTVTSSFATNAATATSASFASTAISASFATTASFALNAAGTNTGSLMVTGSATSNVLTFTKGDGSTFALTVNTGSAVSVSTGSLMVTGSATLNVLTFTKGDGSTFNLTVNTGSAVTVNTGSFYLSSSVANATITFNQGDGTTEAVTVNNVSNAISASIAQQVSSSISSENKEHNVLFTDTTGPGFVQIDGGLRYNPNTNLLTTTASLALNAQTATSASFATSAATASFLPSTTNLNITSITASGANFVNLTATSASIGYLQTITGSAVIIGEEFIILNAATPAARYAGLIVYDSGSISPATASFEWDGLTDNWIIQEETSNTAVVLTGPTGSRGAEVLPTVNVLQKGGGHHQLVNSSITDNGSNVTFTTPIAGTSISASSGFLGNLAGTASNATSASHALNANNAISSSFATTAGSAGSSTTAVSASHALFADNAGASLTATSASHALNANNAISSSFATNSNTATSASFATTALNATSASFASFATSASFAPSTPTFPFTGSAIITGSLAVTGSTTILDVAGGISRIGINRRIELGNGILNNSIGTLGDTNGIIVCNSSNVSANSAVSVAVGCGSTLFAGTFAAMIGCEGTQQTTTFNARGMLVAGLENGGAAGNKWANDGASTYSALVGGGSQRMEFAKYTGILGGSFNYISGSSTFTISGSAIVGGNNNTAKHNNVVILGGSNISSSAANTVYVPNLDVSGSSTFRQSTVLSGSIRGEVNALSIASNTASLNCALDNFYTLQLVSGSNTFINPSNILPGQTINLRINTTGSATVSFPSSVLQSSGSAYVPTTTTGVDVVTFISFDSTSLLLSNVKNLI